VQAARENRVIFSNNAQADHAFLFGDNYSAAEINSTAVLPLFVADKVVGMFALYSREGDFFDDDELKLLAELAGDISLNGSTMRVSAKVGIALFPEDAVTADQLFKMAEAALKRAKKDGDRCLFYTPEMTQMVASRLSLENRLRGALEKNQFLLHYQPIVNFSSGAVCGAEALLRWNCPGRGLVQPDNFIPILEETGMIHEVGRWVLRQAIDDYLRWRQLGVPDFRIAVNLSQLQLRDPGFLAIVKQLLDVDAHAAAGLELEITEGLVMADVEQNIKSFSALRELGVRISIDDFGTGYSSLSHLTRLPLDTLKIDRSFVKDMTLSSAGHVLVHAIVSLAHLLEMNVLAEGVETEEQSDCLKLLNCNEMQGFLFSKPLPADAFEEKMVAANASPLVSRCLSNTSDCSTSAG